MLLPAFGSGMHKILRIMRLTIFLTLICVIQVFAEKGYSQTTSLTVELKNETIENVLLSIEEQSRFVFLYNKDMIDVKRKVDVRFIKANVEEVLESIFDGTGVNYRIIDNQIALSPGYEDQTQNISVSGKVTSLNGEFLPGVAVVVKGTSQGTVTDFDGAYSLSDVPADGTLVFSFVGMKAQEVPVNQKSQIDVVLEEETIGLEEVVAVGYGVQKKVNLTGAITAVKMEELSNISTPNLSNSLAGRAPGVNITGTSGLAGATSKIRIRGGFGEPLFVIDGIVREKEAFDALEAGEVEQLSFLKDAATASIYGSRAGNGVILVTTKKGKKQKPTFNFQSSYTTSSPTQTLLSDQTTATDELIYQNRVAAFNGTTPPNGPEEFAYFENRSYNVNDFIWQNPWSQKHSLSVAGGSDKITYYSIASYRGEEGSYTSLEHQKFNLRSNVSAKISDAIQINLNISANQQNHDRFYWPFSPDDDYDVSDLYRVTFNWPKVYPFYTLEDGTPANYVTDFPVQTPMGSWLAWSVIDQIVGDRYIKTRKRELNTILSLDIKLDKYISGLSTKVVGNYIGADYMRKRYLTFQKNYVFNQADPDGNRFVPAAPDPNKVNTFTFSQNQPYLSYELNTSWSYQFNWFLNYKKSFGKHSVDAMAVWEQSERGLYGAYVKAEDPVTTYDQDFVYSTDSERRYGRGWEEIGARQSLIGRLNYNFNERYIAEFSFRYDGNTLFPKSKRWGFFPSISAAWRISEEGFMDVTDSWLDDLKLRVSYGTTGNDLDVNNEKIRAFSYTNVYQNAGNYIFGDELYRSIKPGATPNPSLTWATSTTYNAGIDFTMLTSKLSGTLDVFSKKETDILGSRLVTLPDNYGQSLAPENYAERSWKGGELTITWRDRAIKNQVNYSVYGNIGYAKDQWDVIDEGEAFLPGGSREWASKIGNPLDRIFGYNSLGIVRTQEQLDELLASGFKQFGRDPYLGGLLFEDIRGDGYSEGPDGKIDSNDQQLLSENAAPRINYGFGVSASWKNFSIDAHFQGVGVYDRMISNKEGAGIRQWGGTVRPYYPIWTKDVWTPDNPDGEYPRPVGKNWYESGTGASSFWIRNGAYMRLKNLNVGYNLPAKWLSAINVASAQLFFNGTNLFAISKIKEFHDPEQKEYDSYPLMKSFTFGLDIKF
ncbi:TonB-linked outer membrane protein, SusC/RagA family [Sunxiuqinia elliptica]|uniref:TonB-linked outer membrane protein, SusC/RagA family n=2 Tax=Sunxiuqinia elliptica TaxID=655355 RepID=A0A1I2F0E1_9BACT|nr:TonB-linked outer membrane protein, SusC/RagA family [Sunxiuqinia elliptica]